MSHCNVKTMFTHFYLLLVLINLCNGIFGADIFIYVYKNKSGELYLESQTIQYSSLEDEAVVLTCSISGNTVNNGVYPTLTWIEGGKEWTPPTNGVSITTTKVLKDDDDGSELKCRARSEVLGKEWTISAYFEKQKSPQEILEAQSSVFKLLLIGIGGIIGASILLLTIYRLFLYCRKKRASNQMDNEKVLYSEVNKKTNNTEHNPKLTEIGFDNIACHLKDNETTDLPSSLNETYISFDSPESDQHFDNEKTLKICEIDCPDKKNHKDDEVSLEKTKDDSDC